VVLCSYQRPTRGTVCGTMRSMCGTDAGCSAINYQSRFTQTPQQNHPLSPLHEPLHWTAKRDPEALMLSLQSFLRKGVSLGYVGLNSNLKDLKDLSAGQVALSACDGSSKNREHLKYHHRARPLLLSHTVHQLQGCLAHKKRF